MWVHVRVMLHFLLMPLLLLLVLWCRSWSRRWLIVLELWTALKVIRDPLIVRRGKWCGGLSPTAAARFSCRTLRRNGVELW
jgi:hypothetical protein